MNTKKYKNTYRVESTRLKNYDYSQNGYYFITICTKDRKCYFGEIVNSEMQLSEIGKIVKQYWLEIPKHFSFAVMDEFVIMPNHVHGIVVIENHINDNNANINGRDAINRVSTGGITGKNNPMLHQSISKIIRWHKGRCTFEINKMQGNIFFAWQSRFYDRIIRNERELKNTRQYIVDNPKNWEKDELYL